MAKASGGYGDGWAMAVTASFGTVGLAFCSCSGAILLWCCGEPEAQEPITDMPKPEAKHARSIAFMLVMTLPILSGTLFSGVHLSHRLFFHR